MENTENVWVKIHHPDMPDNDDALVTVEAFNKLHSGKGWLLVEDADLPGEVAETVARTHSTSKKKSAKSSKP